VSGNLTAGGLEKLKVVIDWTTIGKIMMKQYKAGTGHEGANAFRVPIAATVVPHSF
jgi:hypothetical protein